MNWFPSFSATFASVKLLKKSLLFMEDHNKQPGEEKYLLKHL